MTQPLEKRRLSVDEQIKILNSSGGSMKYPTSTPQSTDILKTVKDVYQSVHGTGEQVSPAIPHDIKEAPDTGTTMGRGNSPSRSGGSNMPARVQGLQDPSPYQQEPSEPLAVDDEVSFQIVVPKDGRDPYVVAKGSGHGNPYGPHGIISPRTAGGQAANDPDVLKKSLARQLAHPVEIPSTQKEGSFDPIRDVDLGPSTRGLGASPVVALRDPDNQLQSPMNVKPVGAGVTGKTSTDNPNARLLQRNVPRSQLGDGESDK
jgi:hypothetical protein